MDFAKFVSMLEDRALYFARADKLGDPFEGASGITERQDVWDAHYLSFFRDAIATVPGRTTQPTEEELEKESKRLLSELRMSSERERLHTFASCWHANTVESEALWRLYCPPSTMGVAIQTTAETLQQSLTSPLNVELGKVQYLDFKKAFAGPYERIFSKRKSLSHEAEVRAVIKGNYFEESPLGHAIEVDLSQLLLAVIPSPFAPPWFTELVQKTLRRFDLDVPVRGSELLAEPFF